MPGRDALARVYAYHDRTKHHVNRFARSLGYLDWATQPDPFRTFDGSPRIDLVPPLTALTSLERVGYDDLFLEPVSQPRATGLAAV